MTPAVLTWRRASASWTRATAMSVTRWREPFRKSAGVQVQVASTASSRAAPSTSWATSPTGLALSPRRLSRWKPPLRSWSVPVCSMPLLWLPTSRLSVLATTTSTSTPIPAAPPSALSWSAVRHRKSRRLWVLRMCCSPSSPTMLAGTSPSGRTGASSSATSTARSSIRPGRARTSMRGARVASPRWKPSSSGWPSTVMGRAAPPRRRRAPFSFGVSTTSRPRWRFLPTISSLSVTATRCCWWATPRLTSSR